MERELCSSPPSEPLPGLRGLETGLAVLLPGLFFPFFGLFGLDLVGLPLEVHVLWVPGSTVGALVGILAIGYLTTLTGAVKAKKGPGLKT